jgi:hypothetical protein
MESAAPCRTVLATPVRHFGQEDDVPWVATLFCVLCLGVAAVHLVALVTPGRDRLGTAAHALMGLGMAGMFSPVGDPVPGQVWVVGFVAVGAWFGAVALRAGTWAGEPVHHVVGSVAMLLMLVPSGPATGDHAGHAGHAAHGGGGAPLGLVSVASVLLAGYFVWHGMRVLHGWRAGRARPAPPAAAPPEVGAPVAVLPVGVGRARLGPDTAVAAHLVMATAMAGMLLNLV